jgi:RNA polymerase sigma factor (sigma-70 family)
MDASDYTRYRPLLFSIAYRMTASVGDAEDIVQEAFLHAAKGQDASNPKAYLATITTRLAIDHLRSGRPSPAPAAASTRAGRDSTPPGPRAKSWPACSWPWPAAGT